MPGVARANYMLFPRLLAIAEVGWTPKETRRWNDFTDRLEYNLIRLKNLGIGYAPSMYNVTVSTVPDTLQRRILVKLSTEEGRVPIHYTTDGSDPSASSALYEGPVALSGTAVTLKAAAFRDGNRVGRITVKTFSFHKATGARVSLSVQPSPRHDPGVYTLTDGLLDGADPQSLLWTGWEGTSPTVLIDLGKKDTIHTVTVNCLNDQRSWIFLPVEIRVYVSRDGDHFMTRGILYRELKKSPDQEPIPLELNIPPTFGRYVRVVIKSPEKCPEWHRGAGKKAWLFIDEIMVE